jgi:putative ATPase
MASDIGNLFSEVEQQARDDVAPLAARMRPTSLDEFVGQEQAVGPGTWLRQAIEDDALSSIVLYGPAGSGKTTLARIIAHESDAAFVEVSAVSGTVSDLRREIAAATERLTHTGRRTILFIDEIHRFSRSQQDALLHAVEDRRVIMVGATTENPFFEVNTALLSRSRVVEFSALSDDDVECIVRRAVADERGLAGRFVLTDETRGGARVITATSVAQASPRRALPYDRNADMHYDIVSAFIKSMRGSDPDAAVYWLARMIEGGEDPRFIARRILILASEDIGNADPQALLVAEAAFKSAESIGYPECRINLAQAAIYMALAPKSNSAITAIDAALDEIRTGPARAVPAHLRDRHRPGSESYGTYCYPHDYPGGWVDQRYLPEGLERGAFYTPGERGWEAYRMEATRGDRPPDASDDSAAEESAG